MIEPYSENACTQKRFDKLNQFYNKNKAKLGTAGQIVEEVLDKIKANFNWREKFFDAVFRHLERVLKETRAGNEETTNTNENDKIIVDEEPTTTGRIRSGQRNSWWRTMINYLMKKGWMYQEAKAIISDRSRLNNILRNDPHLRYLPFL